ncbi:MAG: hypothetical protein ACLFSB_14990 [Chitinispirillaceae bacterium]
MKRIYFILSTILLLFLWGCEDDPVKPENDCTVRDGSVAEITYPAGGETFYVGDTVEIRFKVDSEYMNDVAVMVRAPGQGDVSIYTSGIDVSDDEKYQCITSEWVIGEEPDSVDYQSEDSFQIHVYQYGSASLMNATSNAFTVLER